MIREAIANLFNPDKKVTKFCTVTKRVSSASYELVDIAGRKLFAQSTVFYPPGATVTVEGDRITGRGLLSGKHKFYEV